MLVTSSRCCQHHVGDRFNTLRTSPTYQTSRQHTYGKLYYIMILPPTSEISHHHNVTNITNQFHQSFRILVVLIPWCVIYKWNIFRVLFVDGMGSVLRVLLQMPSASIFSTIQIEKIFPSLACAQEVAKIQKDERKLSSSIFTVGD